MIGSLSQVSRSSFCITLLLTSEETTGMMQRAARFITRFPSRLPSSSASSSPHCVLEKYDTMWRSNIRRRGRSVVAALPSESEKPLKGRKRMGKAERRVMIESFVQNYRDVNEGKFPTISLVKKQLGGSYYVVREILQQLIYESQFPSSDTREKTDFPKPKEHTENDSDWKERHSSDEREGISSSSDTQVCAFSEKSTSLDAHSPTVYTPELDESQSLKVVETNKELSTLDHEKFLNRVHDFNSHSVQQQTTTIPSVEVTVSPSNISDTEDALDGHPDSLTVIKFNENAQTEPIADHSQIRSGELGSSSGDAIDCSEDRKEYGSENVHEPAYQKNLKTKDLHRNMPLLSESPKPSKSSTVWSNLKSFANDLINFWKRV